VASLHGSRRFSNPRQSRQRPVSICIQISDNVASGTRLTPPELIRSVTVPVTVPVPVTVTARDFSKVEESDCFVNEAWYSTPQ
jgi:hypothetical protein